METVNSYRIDSIISQYCSLLENTDWDTDFSDKLRYLLVTHSGTQRGNQRCAYVEALNYLEDYELKNEKLGMSMMEDLAHSGYLDAIKYIAGKYEESDANKAIQLYSACLENPNCDKGYIYYRLGVLYASYGEKYYSTAIQYLNEAAENYNLPAAQYQMACMYYLGNGVERNLEAAIALCKRAADGGDVNAQYWLGKDYYVNEELPVGVNYELAYTYLKASADQGHPSAKYYIGLMYYFGKGKKRDYSEAENWFNEAILYGNVPGAYAFLGEIYFETGKYEDALKNLKISLEDYDLDIGLETLAKMYREGKGGPVRNDLAIKIYDRMHSKDTLSRENAIFAADCYYFGNGVPKNLAKAASYYKIFADNDPTLMFRLGEMALNNDIPNLTVLEAVSYFTGAAEKGLIDGYKMLGDYYYNLGDMFHDRALDFYKKSFSAGCADAAVYVGRIYEKGSAMNIYASNSEAVKWYKMAADNGSETGKKEFESFKKTILGYKRISN